MTYYNDDVINKNLFYYSDNILFKSEIKGFLYTKKWGGNLKKCSFIRFMIKKTTDIFWIAGLCLLFSGVFCATNAKADTMAASSESNSSVSMTKTFLKPQQKKASIPSSCIYLALMNIILYVLQKQAQKHRLWHGEACSTYSSLSKQMLREKVLLF